MIKWEYKIDTVPNHDMVDYIGALNILGDGGWELVNEEMCADVDESVCTFKRQRACFDDPGEVFSDN